MLGQSGTKGERKTMPAGQAREIAKADFAQKLQAALDVKGWRRTDLEHAVQRIMGATKFSRNNMSKYLNAKAFPRDNYLKAMAKALGVPASQLYPRFKDALMSTDALPFNIRDLGNGRMWVTINAEVSRETAQAMMEAYNASQKLDRERDNNNGPSRRTR